MHHSKKCLSLLCVYSQAMGTFSYTMYEFAPLYICVLICMHAVAEPNISFWLCQILREMYIASIPTKLKNEFVSVIIMMQYLP